MTHRIKINCSENSTTRTSHVFITEPRENHQETHHPFFIMCEDETEAQFMQLMRDSLKAYLYGIDTCLCITQKSRWIPYRWENVESEFISILKEAFNWMDDIEVEYISTEEPEYFPETTLVKYPLRA